ncbi:MAG: PmeII family type II restriction endonuclease [Candidatus Hinthialibacter sp.]
MNVLNIKDVTNYVESNIGDFHFRRLENLKKLKLDKIIQRKNPYLYKAKNILTSQDFVTSILDAHLSSQEEGIFGDFLEGLAIFINQIVYNGRKSMVQGIDLEFEKGKIQYIVSIKSGPNWGNSQQIKRMKENFKTASRTLRTSNSKLHVQAVNGCCYGRDKNPDKGDYYKYCGQLFWEFISGDANLYTKIIEPLGYKAKEKNDEFQQSYSQLINKITLEFSQNYCIDGIIDWARIVQINSSLSP